MQPQLIGPLGLEPRSPASKGETGTSGPLPAASPESDTVRLGGAPSGRNRRGLTTDLTTRRRVKFFGSRRSWRELRSLMRPEIIRTKIRVPS